MQIGVAQARERFREVLDRVSSGERVEVTRRGTVIAVVMPASVAGTAGESFGRALQTWRETWDVESWPDEDPFDDVRDRGHGRVAPW